MKHRQHRNKPSQELLSLINEATSLHLYLIHEKGPLSLLFQDDASKKYHITIGNNITCSCSTSSNPNTIHPHCIHILYTLLKYFKLPYNNPLLFQTTFTDNEINKLLEYKHQNTPSPSIPKCVPLPNQIQPTNQMNLIDDTVCPICQEDLYSNEGLYYCKDSCGHNFHISCLKIFIKHKQDSESDVTCPLCRYKWNEDSYENILHKTTTVKCYKVHKGINCVNCSRMNIKFERFHCLYCDNMNLCVECFNNGIHKSMGHKFIMKKSADDKWVGVEYKDDNDNERKYVIRKIHITQYLISCLNDYDINSNSNSNNGDRKCCVCQGVVHVNKCNGSGNVKQLLMYKELPNCKCVLHLRCCDKMFKVYEYDVHSKSIVVDVMFNKCKEDNTIIFKGLTSIKQRLYIKHNSNSNNNVKHNEIVFGMNELFIGDHNNVVVRNVKTKSVSKRKYVKMFMEGNCDKDNKWSKGNEIGFGLDIQKVKFDCGNGIKGFESSFNNRKIFGEKESRMIGRVYKNEGLMTLKKRMNTKMERGGNDNGNDTIIAKNRTHIGEIGSLVVTKLPNVWERNGKGVLSPLLIDLPE